MQEISITIRTQVAMTSGKYYEYIFWNNTSILDLINEQSELNETQKISKYMLEEEVLDF